MSVTICYRGWYNLPRKLEKLNWKKRKFFEMSVNAAAPVVGVLTEHDLQHTSAVVGVVQIKEFFEIDSVTLRLPSQQRLPVGL